FLERASAHDWPGNIRELENFVERFLIMGSLDRPSATRTGKEDKVSENPLTLEELERAHIKRVLESTAWVIEGEKGAARLLGLNPSTLRGRLRKLGIRKTS